MVFTLKIFTITPLYRLLIYRYLMSPCLGIITELHCKSSDRHVRLNCLTRPTKLFSLYCMHTFFLSILRRQLSLQYDLIAEPLRRRQERLNDSHRFFTQSLLPVSWLAPWFVWLPDGGEAKTRSRPDRKLEWIDVVGWDSIAMWNTFDCSWLTILG